MAESKAMTTDCAFCGEKHGEPIIISGMKLYTCPNLPDSDTIYPISDETLREAAKIIGE